MNSGSNLKYHYRLYSKYKEIRTNEQMTNTNKMIKDMRGEREKVKDVREKRGREREKEYYIIPDAFI